jgi:hypothetical protein
MASHPARQVAFIVTPVRSSNLANGFEVSIGFMWAHNIHT